MIQLDISELQWAMIIFASTIALSDTKYFTQVRYILILIPMKRAYHRSILISV